MSAITTQPFHRDLFVVAQAKLDIMTDGELTELVKETNGKTLQAAKQTLLHVAQTGLVLIALKEKTGHGRFMKDVEWKTGISQRTANNYMALARHYRNVSNLKNVTEALKYLKEASAAARRIDERSALALAKPQPRKEESTPPAPRPASSVTLEAELVEPAPSPAPITQEPLVIDTPPTPELHHDELPTIEEPESLVVATPSAPDEDRLPISDQKTADIEESAEAFDQILGLLKKLSNDQLIELRRIITARWT